MTDGLIKGNGYRLQVAGQPLSDFMRRQPIETAFIHGGKLFAIAGEILATFDTKDFPGMEASGNGRNVVAGLSETDKATLKDHEAILGSPQFKQIMELAVDVNPTEGR